MILPNLQTHFFSNEIVLNINFEVTPPRYLHTPLHILLIDLHFSLFLLIFYTWKEKGTCNSIIYEFIIGVDKVEDI